MLAWIGITLALAPGASAQDATTQAMEALVSGIRKREAALRGARVEQYYLVEVIAGGEPLRVDTVELDKGVREERWERRVLVIDQALRSSWVPNGHEFPEQAFAAASRECSPSITVWDGGRMLHLQPQPLTGTATRWEGRLANKFDPFHRRGPMNVALLHGDRWLSEATPNWTCLGFRRQGDDAAVFLIRAPYPDPKRATLHRMRVAVDEGYLPIQHIVSTIAISDVNRAIERFESEPLVPLSGEQVQFEKWTRQHGAFEDVSMPTHTGWTAAHTPRTRCASWLRYSRIGENEDPTRWDPRVVPSKCLGATVQITDELTGIIQYFNPNGKPRELASTTGPMRPCPEASVAPSSGGTAGPQGVVGDGLASARGAASPPDDHAHGGDGHSHAGIDDHRHDEGDSRRHSLTRVMSWAGVAAAIVAALVVRLRRKAASGAGTREGE
jgi:hypothetical protein